jgi:peptide deformylase
MIREIVQYGHPVLRQRCRPVTEVDDEIIQLVGDMLDTMVAANGVGLAAPQVGEICGWPSSMSPTIPSAFPSSR